MPTNTKKPKKPLSKATLRAVGTIDSQIAMGTTTNIKTAIKTVITG